MHDSRFLSVRRCCAVVLLLPLLLLQGCSLLNWWPQEQGGDEQTVVPASVAGWQIMPGQQQALTQLLTGRGLVTPVLTILPDGELLPDYARSARLYKDITSAGLRLASGDRVLGWHYRIIAAVEHSCPEQAISPLGSCDSGFFGHLFRSSDALLEQELVDAFLEQEGVDYLLISDPQIYLSEAVGNLRYAPSSRPLIQRSRAQRWAQLSSLRQQAELVLVAVDRSGQRRTLDWQRVVARCRLPMMNSGSDGGVFQHRRNLLLDQLRQHCMAGLALLVAVD